MALKAVGLDCDGIILKKLSSAYRAESINYALDKMREEGYALDGISYDDIRDGERYEDFFERILNNDFEAVCKALDHRFEFFKDLDLSKVKAVIPEGLEIMRFLKRNNIPFFIATNNPTNQLFFDKLFRDEFPDVQVFAPSYREGIPSKPDPRIINQGFESLGIDPNKEDTAFIGDGLNKDVQGALAAGTYPIYLHKGSFGHLRGLLGHGMTIAGRILRYVASQTLTVHYDGKDHEIFASKKLSEIKKFLSGRTKSFANLKDFVNEVQGDKNLGQIYKGIEQKQLLLASYVLKAGLKVAFDKVKDETGEQPFRVDEVASKIMSRCKNDFCVQQEFNSFMEEHGLDLRMTVNGHKTKERAIQKARGLGVNPNELADFTRVSVVGSLDNVQRTRAELAATHRHYSNDWTIRNSGLLSSGFRLAVDGVVGQVLFGEDHQLNQAYPISHKIYEIRRDYDDYKITDDPEMLASIKSRYSSMRNVYDSILTGENHSDRFNKAFYEQNRLEVIRNFMEENDITLDFPDIETEADLKKGLDQLFVFHQIIHMAYLDKAEDGWKKLYVNKAKELNQTAGRTIIPLYNYG